LDRGLEEVTRSVGYKTFAMKSVWLQSSLAELY